jgi:peptidoglycan/xylan/chitin deacetylase (PgdA/CDA1 family)
VTVDDGYRNYLLHGHPIFRKYRIPATLYPVAGFADRRLWLWTDKVWFAIENTSRKSVRATIGGKAPMELSLASPAEKEHAANQLWEALKLVENGQRVDFVDRLGTLFGVEVPETPPEPRASLTWDEMRGLAAEDVEIGCHTYSHPILSRLQTSSELEYEIRGAKELMEERLKMPVIHFCYPNGREIDIGEAAAGCVQAAGFASAATCTWGLNQVPVNRLHMRRIPLDSTMDYNYATELTAGLHM